MSHRHELTGFAVTVVSAAAGLLPIAFDEFKFQGETQQ
jgi:hypothetical protein